MGASASTAPGKSAPMDTWLWTPLTHHVSRDFNRIRNIVDSAGGNPENEPELATDTIETTGRWGAAKPVFQHITASISGEIYARV